MSNIDDILVLVVPLALVFFRVAGLFVASPLLASASIPVRFRVMLAGALSVAILPAAPCATDAGVSIVHAGAAAITETAIGYIMGCIASIPVLAMEMAGAILGQQAGFGLGRVYNPEIDSDSDAIGQLLTWMGFAIFVTIDGLESLFGAIAGSYHGVPAGAAWNGVSPLDAGIAAMSAGGELALRVSAPVVGLILLITAALGVIGRTVPQLNVMAVGFTVKVLAALCMLAACVAAVDAAAGDAMSDVLAAAREWLDGLAGAGGGHA